MNGPAMTVTTSAMPRLGDPFIEDVRQLPLQAALVMCAGIALVVLRSPAGQLTVLVEHGVTVAVHVPYPPGRPRKAELRALQAQLAPANGAGFRLLIGDSGWLLALYTCTALGLQLLIEHATQDAGDRGASPRCAWPSSPQR